MEKQSKVAVAESAAKVLTASLLNAVKQTALARAQRERVLCWSNRECIAREKQSAMSYAHEYYRYAHSMD